jgi:hypothetical protein
MCPPYISQRPRCATKKQWRGEESEEQKRRKGKQNKEKGNNGHGKGI